MGEPRRLVYLGLRGVWGGFGGFRTEGFWGFGGFRIDGFRGFGGCRIEGFGGFGGLGLRGLELRVQGLGV